ncbi:midkine-A-like isoform X2 [Euwallacea similis]|uniref:midkine-A-like isoform X2 n=1 Tax=Euwallacea similis TaxID=1736056 RepID=UPI00344DD3A1
MEILGKTRMKNRKYRRGTMKWLIFFALTVIVALASAEGEVWEEDDHEVLIRSERGAKNQECRYTKGAWSECDSKTNQRSRTLTLKKGNQTSCEPTKTMQKKCKKACRYEKGTWAECNAQGQMTRSDKLKAGSDPSCDQKREITKKCKSKPAKSQSAKAARRNNRN